MTDQDQPQSSGSRLLSGLLGGLLESAGVGCLAPIAAIVLVAGSIALFGGLPIWALYASLIALLAIGVLAVVAAVRQR